MVWALLTAGVWGIVCGAVALLVLSVGGCTYRYEAGKGGHVVRNVWQFDEVLTEAADDCYTTPNGIVVRVERGVERCPSPTAVTHEVQTTLRIHEIEDPDAFEGVRVVFLSAPLQCKDGLGGFIWAAGCTNGYTIAIVNRSNWREVLRHELTHVLLMRNGDWSHEGEIWKRIERGE